MNEKKRDSGRGGERERASELFCRCMIWPLIYGGNVSKNARPIELHWVTCRYATYLWAERSLGKFIVRPFGYVWFWKIVAVRNYDPTHAPRVLARARRPYLFAPRVLSGNHLLSLSFFLILFFRRSDHIISLSLSLSLSNMDVVFPIFGCPRFPAKYAARGNDAL